MVWIWIDCSVTSETSFRMGRKEILDTFAKLNGILLPSDSSIVCIRTVLGIAFSMSDVPTKQRLRSHGSLSLFFQCVFVEFETQTFCWQCSHVEHSTNTKGGNDSSSPSQKKKVTVLTPSQNIVLVIFIGLDKSWFIQILFECP